MLNNVFNLHSLRQDTYCVDIWSHLLYGAVKYKALHLW